MRIARSVTRPAHLLGAVSFALLLAGCSEQPTAPETVHQLAPATAGSIIRSNVVTTTTLCPTPTSCKATTQTKEIRERVAGSERELRAALAMVAGGNGQAPSTRSFAGYSNVHLSGRTLSFDKVMGGRKVWHVELTHDALAKGKVSAMRLSLDGKPLLTQNTKWKPVSGVWYREHADATLYHEGRLAMHQDAAFTPLVVVAPAEADVSDKSAPITISAIDGTEITYDGGGGGCPELVAPICTWMQSNEPLTGLEAVWQGLGNAGFWINNFFNSLWAGNRYDAALEMATTAEAILEASVQPNLVNIATAISASAGGAITDTLLEDFGAEIWAWLLAGGLIL